MRTESRFGYLCYIMLSSTTSINLHQPSASLYVDANGIQFTEYSVRNRSNGPL
jgi:hypothetical protein